MKEMLEEITIFTKSSEFVNKVYKIQERDQVHYVKCHIYISQNLNFSLTL